MLEITQIEELNRQSSLETVSENKLQAKLLVEWYRSERDGWDYHLEGNVRNIGPIPLNSVYAGIEWKELDSGQTVITQKIPVYVHKIGGKQYAGFLPPDYTAHFEIAFKDKRLLSFDELVFLTPSGEIIPYEIDFEFLKKQAGL